MSSHIFRKTLRETSCNFQTFFKTIDSNERSACSLSEDLMKLTQLIFSVFQVFLMCKMIKQFYEWN